MVRKPLGDAEPSFSDNSSATCVEQQQEKFKGLRMNDLLLKGPDVLNPSELFC